MYMYIYTYMYTYMYIHIFTCLYICIYAGICHVQPIKMFLFSNAAVSCGHARVRTQGITHAQTSAIWLI